MIDWLTIIGPVIAAVSIILLPGMALFWAARLRGLALVAAAPVGSIATIGLAALILGLLEIRWSVLSFAGALGIMLVGAFVARIICASGRVVELAPRVSSRTLISIGVLIGATFTMWRLASYIADPVAISQTNDAVFHLNAIRFISESGSASSLDVNGFMGGSNFYPAGWHAFVSLVMFTTGVDVPLAVNASTLVIGGVVWTLGIAWLARVIFKSNVVGAVSGVLAGAFQTFPMLMFQWGVLYPNALSIALIPASLALVFCLREWASRGSSGWRLGWRAYVMSFLIVMVVMAALALAQPAALIPWGLIVCIAVTSRLWEMKDRSVVLRLAVAAAMWLALFSLWWQLSRSTSGSHWSPFRDKYAVFLDILFNGHMLIPFAFGLSLFMLAGLAVSSITPSLRWLVAAWLALSALYVASAAVGVPFVRDGILGAWYADPYRLAALTPIIVVPLAAFGVVTVVRWLMAGFARERSVNRLGTSSVAAAIVIMVVIVMLRPVAMPVVAAQRFETQPAYAISDDSYLSLDERELLGLLVDDVPADARVIANPSTGSGFGYMLTGLDVFPSTWSPPQSAEWQVIADSLREASSDPAVCLALQSYGDPQYVLDFGPGEWGGGRYEARGMTDFEGQIGFELIRAVGDASLWHISACNS